MQIFPAIDLSGGRVVRLTQGDYSQMTVYGGKPVNTALHFRQEGAKNLHIVDLEGAKDAALCNFDVIAGLVRESGLFTEVGGGIRDETRVLRYLDAGVGRVILGTAALTDRPFLARMVRRYADKIAVGVDMKDGKVAVGGWLRVTDTDGASFCRAMRDEGVSTLICTDISRDGALSGTNLELYRQLNEISGVSIIASGGVSSLAEIRALRDMGVSGAILGKSLYAGRLTLKEALAAAEEEP